MVLVGVMLASGFARAEEDGGASVQADAGTPTLGFDVVQGGWGPGRKSSGELYRSASTSVTEGPLRWRWSDYSLAIGGQYFARGEVRDGRDFSSASPDLSLGVDQRVRLGARGFGALGPVVLVGEAAFQTGKACTPACTTGQVDDTVLAGAFAAKATYTLPVWGSLYVTGEFSAASGDGEATDGVEHTFHPLFPTAHIHLGYMDYVGWQNVVAAHGTVGFRPWGAHVWLDVHHFRAWDPRGTWYAASGAVFLAADPARISGNMGTELDLSVTVPVFANVSLAGNVSVFLPGLEAASRGTSPSTWGFLSIRTQI